MTVWERSLNFKMGFQWYTLCVLQGLQELVYMVKHPFWELSVKNGKKNQAHSLKGKAVSISNTILPQSQKWVSMPVC